MSEGSPLSGDVVDRVIASAQANNEALITNVIANTQEADYHLSIMRKKVYDQRMRMLKGESPKENMEFIIDTSVNNLIDKNIPDTRKGLTPRTKIKSSGINMNNLIIDTMETFGVDLTEEIEKGTFKRLGDIATYVSSKAKENYAEIRSKNGDKKQDVLDRDAIISTIDNAWRNFNEDLEYIKFSNNMYALAQNKDFNEIYAMKQGFNQAMVDSKISMLGKMMGKKSILERTKREDELPPEIDESLNEYNVETQKTATNISVRPAKIMTTLSNGIKLIKEKIKYQFELVPVEEGKEQVERMNFDNGEQEVTTTVNHRR